jgi:DNA-binding response OmpR family regulator
MSPEKTKILVVDDEPSLLSLIRDILADEGCEILTAPNGKTALEVFKERQPSLVLLDVMLPDINGYIVCKRIRQISTVPIIMVTAKDGVEEETVGLECGADDYIKKPFIDLVLIARVKAAFRRSLMVKNQSIPSSFQYQDLKIDFSRQAVIVGRESVKLTITEYKILSVLALNTGSVVTPTQIINEIWGEKHQEGFHVLQVNISRLRQKLGGNSNDSKYIETVSNQGYVIPMPDRIEPLSSFTYS